MHYSCSSLWIGEAWIVGCTRNRGYVVETDRRFRTASAFVVALTHFVMNTTMEAL